MTSLEQQRMKLAWELLSDPRRLDQDESAWKNKDNAKKYLTALRRTPSRIHTSGLGQALAFLRSRDADAGKHAYADLSKGVRDLLGRPGSGDLLAELRTGDLAFLMRATDETMLLATWMTRYLTGAGVKTLVNDEGENP